MQTQRAASIKGIITILVGFSVAPFIPVTNVLAASFDPLTMEVISEATFEVVVPKPETDLLSYEKKLPLDLIPFAIRNDKYYSVGTAFAIGNERFVSAAHVMGLGLKSQLQDFYLRGKEGKIYAIDKITKYANDRDFVIFTLKNRPTGKVYALNTQPKFNEKVYAIGNALGEGVVIRDGLYTSNTPEERSGAWNWIRFSAAASPGNSGGPLVDSDGKVIGVVLRKSNNENLNYALPIAEVLNAKDNLAITDTRLMYRLDNMDMTKLGNFRQEIPLPMDFRKLNQTLVQFTLKLAQELLSGLLAENRDNIFPRGNGSLSMLHKTSSAIFPSLIAKSGDGNWDTFYPEKRNNADLGRNGQLVYGQLWHSLILYLQKPDDVPSEKLYRDPKFFMDLLLKGMPMIRPVGAEKIKITSMGKAQEDYLYTDAYQRKWQVRVWSFGYVDQVVATFCLPVPAGYTCMIRSSPTFLLDGNIADFKVLADFYYVSYYGKLSEWQEFLKFKDLLPPQIAGLAISMEYGKRFSYRSNRLQFSYEPEVMNISSRSDLELRMSYFQDREKIVWDVAKILIGEDKSSGAYFEVSRYTRPPITLGDQHRQIWEKIVQLRLPYNGSAYFENKRTYIGTVYAKGMPPNQLETASILYTVMHSTEGKLEQQALELKLNQFMKAMTVYE